MVNPRAIAGNAEEEQEKEEEEEEEEEGEEEDVICCGSKADFKQPYPSQDSAAKQAHSITSQ